MILFSAPGAALRKVRAWLLTQPFDLSYQGPTIVTTPIIVVLAAGKSTTVQVGSDAVRFHLPLTEPDGDLLDLTNATGIEVVLVGPDKTRTVDPAAALSPAAAGVIEHTPEADFFPTSGRWKLQAAITFSDGRKYFSTVFKVKVKANL